MPFVSRAALDKLATLVGGGVTITARAEAGANSVYPLRDMFTTEAITAADALWAKIEIGTMVLAEQPHVYGPGWWQGVVVDVKGDDLTIRWLDDAAEEPIHVARRDVALRHPGAD